VAESSREQLVSRRGFALGTAAALAGCQRRSNASSESPAASASGTTSAGARGNTRLLEWSFDGAMSPRTAVLVPTWGDPGVRFPVVVLLHGRGEARKPPAEGALGWPRDYALVRAIERVASPPLVPRDFEGYVLPAQLARHNRTLTDRPFAGLIAVCPYLPDLDLADPEAIGAFGHFVTDTLLPRVRRETPALADASATGIDGVSLGGAVALAVGLDESTAFGAVGTLQPALDPHHAATWAARAQAARRQNPGLAIRLLTSDGDYFRDAVRATSSAMDAAGLTHDFEEVKGPHDYPFNRGPGAIEMLLWHDRILRRHG
jgi:enterochelin esterase-like enzyme